MSCQLSSRTRFASILAAPMLLSIMMPLQAAELAAKSRVSAVTLFPDRALVTRKVNVTIAPGEHEILVSGLPAQLIEQSLRLEGAGGA